LVLESDADRERFKVKRGFQMRDGEKFFAQGRDNADYELIQQQMKLAGNWRTGLRGAVLVQLAALGRDQRQWQQEQYRTRAVFGGGGYGGFGGIINGPVSATGSMSRELNLEMPSSYGSELEQSFEMNKKELLYADLDYLDRRSDKSKSLSFNGDLSMDDISGRRGGEIFPAKEMPINGEFESISDTISTASAGVVMNRLAVDFAPAGRPELRMPFDMGTMGTRTESLRMMVSPRIVVQEEEEGRLGVDGLSTLYYSRDYDINKPRWNTPQQGDQWLTSLFPYLPPAEGKTAVKEPKTKWPAEARALAQGLLRSDQLAQLTGGLEINRSGETFDVRWGDVTSRSETFSLVSARTWLIRSQGGGQQTTVQWCDEKERGIFSKAFQLGRIRASVASDLAKPPLDLGPYALSSLEITYPQYEVELKPQRDNRTLLVLKHPSNPLGETDVMIDTRRHVVLWIEDRQDGKITSGTRCDDFVEATGAWWAGRIETFDSEGRRTSRTVQQFKPIALEAMDRQVAQELAGHDQIQFLREPLPKLTAAKQAVADGKATFDDQAVLLLHFAQIQQWSRAQEYLEKAEKLSDGKPGVRWIRNAFLNVSRRREELKEHILAEAGKLAKPSSAGNSISDELFLANHLIGQTSGILEANEMLALLDALKPVFERQPPYLLGLKQWNQQRVSYLQQTDRTDEWLALQKQLALEYPHNANLQQQYAQSLANSGDNESAYAWISRVLTDDARWLPQEDGMLRTYYCLLLEQEGRYPDLADYLAEWMKRNPSSMELPYLRYLSALVKSGRTDYANETVDKWLRDGRTPDRLKPEAAAKLQAAVEQALGQGYNLYTDRIDERWLSALADAAIFFARSEFQQQIADTIMGNWRFQQTDQCRSVRKDAAALLGNELEKLPADQVQRFVSWIMPNDPVVEPETWKRFAAELHKRWAAETDPAVKGRLAGTLVQILSSRVGGEEYLAFLREQLDKATEENRASCAAALFDALLAQPWSAERENEAFALLDKLSDNEEAAQHLAAEVAALYRLTDRMVQSRFEAGMAKIEHQEKLTRTELAAKRADNVRLAREGFADRIKQEMQKQSEKILSWLNIERLYLDVLLGRNLDRAAEECWEYVGAKPRPTTIAAEDDPGAMLEKSLRHRYLITLMNLAARKNAKPELIDRLLKYLDEALTADGEDSPWKMLKYQLLVALDRPKELEQALQSWIKPGDADNYWRLTLAYLLAEQGKIAEAVKLFETIQAADELGPREYRTLADWYMALNRRELYERSLIESYKVNDEWRLNNWLSQKLRPWQIYNAKPTAELDKEVMTVFAALFEKSGNPQNYLWQLREFYVATRDFRLLACMAEAVVGHTAAAVYPFLQNLGSVLGEIRDEATADSLVEHLAKVRDRAKTGIDRRALDMLELLVERRATELKNQPGPYAEKALKAMQRAFKRQWSAGEKKLMADFLASLGAIPDAKLAEEQLRQLQTLHEESAPGSLDRLHIALRLSNAHWNYSRRQQAVDLLQSALDEYQNALNGVLSSAANDALGTLVSYLEQTRHYDRGEKVLQDQLQHPCNRQQTFWLIERLYELYENAVRNDGDVSLGNAETLYHAVEKNIQKELDSGNENHRAALINRLCGIYNAAHEKKMPTAAEDIKTFAMKRLPEVLKLQTNNYQSVVNQVADALHNVAGPRDALAFLIERVEHEPAWFRLNNSDSWNQFGWKIADWRLQVKPLGDLEERLLGIVIAELRRDLQSRQTHNAAIYRLDHGGNPNHFWAEKADAFARSAEEVLAEQKKSSAAAVYIAQYFYHGLHRFDRAVEILLNAYHENVLDESGQSQLVQFLHEQNRHGESIPILLPLVERRSDNMQYRVWLMHAYFRTNRPAELAELLKQTDAYFHEGNHWNEGAIAALAASCLENQLYERSVEYYKELIPLHQRTQPRRGIGNGTLSDYYGKMAQAYAGLKKTARAVDAACGAIVSWGPRIDQRRSALESLKGVLRQSPDLDAYVVELDKQCAETGLQNPIVRKTVGQIYAEKQQYAKAIAQLKLACELQPNDTETYQQLIDCYDKQGDKTGAIGQLLRAVQLSRRDIKLYQDLGKRYESLGKGKETQRAYTSIVEVLPNEAESHALLGEIRQEQNRWTEAAESWQRVAKIRSLEPTGLLKLAGAQIHLGQWNEAEETLRRLETTGWPARFGDVYGQAAQMRRELEEHRRRKD
jgi:tetratricopeptide (TPR) repeat protein